MYYTHAYTHAHTHVFIHPHIKYNVFSMGKNLI